MKEENGRDMKESNGISEKVKGKRRKDRTLMGVRGWGGGEHGRGEIKGREGR